jgi:hypothetical protein
LFESFSQPPDGEECIITIRREVGLRIHRTHGRTRRRCSAPAHSLVLGLLRSAEVDQRGADFDRLYRGSIDGAQVQVGDTTVAVEIGRRIVVGIADAFAEWPIHDGDVMDGPGTVRIDGDLEAGGETNPVAVIRELGVEPIIVRSRQLERVVLAGEVEANSDRSPA